MNRPAIVFVILILAATTWMLWQVGHPSLSLPSSASNDDEWAHGFRFHRRFGEMAPAFLHSRVIVFSKNRPFQLDGVLRGLTLHVADRWRVEVFVLWTATSKEAEKRYTRLIGDWEDEGVQFVKERSGEFFIQLLALINESAAPTTSFLVDDTVIVNTLDFQTAVNLLEARKDVLGVSLRLGTNLEAENRDIPFQWWQLGPQDARVANAVPSEDHRTVCFDWKKSHGVFAYRIEVSSSIYRRTNLLDWLVKIEGIINPNSLEVKLVFMPHQFVEHLPTLCMFKLGSVVACPYNIVQNPIPGIEVSDIELDQLDKLWDKGYRMDVAIYTGYQFASTHELLPIFLVHPGTNKRLLLVPHSVKSKQ